MSRRIEKLGREHKLREFDCGDRALNEWLSRFALLSQAANAAQTFLGIEDGPVIGFYSLAVGDVDYGPAPEPLREGMARHPVPIMLLARLCVDRRWQGRGVGRSLLKNALQRTLQVADMAGVSALAVHGRDESARAFYERFGFSPSPTDPLHLYLLTKDLKA